MVANPKYLAEVALGGFDFETKLITPGTLTPRPICMSWADNLGVDDPWVKETYTPSGRAAAGNHIMQWLLNPKARLIAHNAAFDLALLVAYCGVPMKIVMEALEQGRIADTMVREQLAGIAYGWTSLNTGGIDNRTGRPFKKGLDGCVLAHFGVDISKGKKDPLAWRLRYHELDGIPVDQWPQAAVDYSIEDSVWAVALYKSQAEFPDTHVGPVVGPDGVLINEVAQTCAAFALHLMAMNGPRTDAKAVEGFIKYHRAQQKKADKIGLELGFLWVNPKRYKNGRKANGRNWNYLPGTSKKADLLKELVVKVLGTTLDKKYLTPTGKAYCKAMSIKALDVTGPDIEWKDKMRPRMSLVTTSSKVLQQFRGPRDSLARKLRTYGDIAGSQKMMDQYAGILESGVKRPLTSMPNVLINTGRTSWAKPNMQNPPRGGGFRDCFVARPGRVYVSCDYSAVEMATLAQVQLWEFGQSAMADIINKGQDLHKAIGAALTGVAYKEFEEAYTKGEKWAKQMRQAGKAANFGLPGGTGPRRLVLTYGVNTFLRIATPGERAQSDDDEVVAEIVAKRIKDAWLAMYPEERKRFRQVSQLTKGDRLFSYRHPVTGRIRGRVGYCDGCNNPFQGLAADGIKDALWEVTKACYLDTDSPLYGCKPWLMVHDEILIEGPQDTAHLWAPEVSRLMVKSMRKYTPDVLQKAEPALCRRWYKDAEPLYYKGKLVPWEPWRKIRRVDIHQDDDPKRPVVVPKDPDDWQKHKWVLDHPLGVAFADGDTRDPFIEERIAGEASLGLL